MPDFLSAIGGFITKTFIRVGEIVLASKIKDVISPSKKPSSSALVKQDNRVKEAEIVRHQSREKREKELSNIRNELATIREMTAAKSDRDERALEIEEFRFEADMLIAKEKNKQAERALEISEKSLQLRKQELDVAKARLRQDGQIAQAQREQMERALQLRERQLQILTEELAERRKLSYLYLDLMREKEAKEIELKLTEIQANWDRGNWPGILSREEMQKILVEGQKKHRLLMLVSPPDISEDCPESFRRNLQMEVRSELKEFIERNYPFNSDLCPVEFYGKYFKLSVFDVEIKQLENLLSPVPTAIIYSDITDHKVYFHVGLWGLQEPVSLTLEAWNWEQEKQKLEAAGMTEKESLLVIRQSIVKMHQLISAFLTDLYYININPYHEPRLFQLEPELPQEWVESHFGILREIYQQRREAEAEAQIQLQQEAERQRLLEEERQREAEAEARRQLQATVERLLKLEEELKQKAEAEAKRKEQEEAERQRQLEEERKQQEEEDKTLGIYLNLRDLLKAGKWKEANEETKMLILKAVERSKEGFLDEESIKKFPSYDLRMIDKLWVKYSNGRFGLSVQKRIFDECDGDLSAFVFHVGWGWFHHIEVYQEYYYYFVTSLRYSINAPKGHLPIPPSSLLTSFNYNRPSDRHHLINEFNQLAHLFHIDAMKE